MLEALRDPSILLFLLVLLMAGVTIILVAIDAQREYITGMYVFIGQLVTALVVHLNKIDALLKRKKDNGDE